MIKKLAVSDIKRKLKKLSGWGYNAKTRAIQAEFKGKDFVAVVRVIGKIAKVAEKMGHHPDLHLTRYRRLKVVFTTHEVVGVTERDFRLAKKIASLVR